MGHDGRMASTTSLICDRFLESFRSKKIVVTPRGRHMGRCQRAGALRTGSEFALLAGQQYMKPGAARHGGDREIDPAAIGVSAASHQGRDLATVESVEDPHHVARIRRSSEHRNWHKVVEGCGGCRPAKARRGQHFLSPPASSGIWTYKRLCGSPFRGRGQMV